MNSEDAGLKCQVKYAKLVKWENDPVSGLPLKDRAPLEIREKFGDEEPFVTTFKREET